MTRPDLKFGSAVAGASKDRVISGTVVDVLGNRCSVKFANNGRVYRGLEYSGGPISVGAKVMIDYSSGRPIAQIYGEAYEPPITRGGTSPRPVTSDTDSDRGGWTDGGGYGSYHYHHKIMQFNGTAIPAEYPPTSAGATTALAAQKRNDVFLFPYGTYTANYTISSGNVSIIGAGVGTVFTGLLTLAMSTGTIQNISVTRSNSSAGVVSAVSIQNATSTVNIYNSRLYSANSSAGGANGINDDSSAGILNLWKASIGAASSGGISTAVTRVAGRETYANFTHFIGATYFNSTAGMHLRSTTYNDGSTKSGRAGSYTNINSTGFLTVPTYERHIQIPAVGGTGTPANAPTPTDFFTAGGLQFASSGSKYTYVQWEIPDDWVGGEDIYMEIDWFPDSGAMSGTDTVKWDIEYRSIAEGETINNGTSVTVSVTDDGDYAQYTTIHSRFTLDYDNANQPLTAQDHMYFKITRDTGVANDFAGTTTVTAFEIIYNSNSMPTSN